MKYKKLVLTISILNIICMVLVVLDLLVFKHFFESTSNTIIIFVKLFIMIALNLIILFCILEYSKKEKEQNMFITNSIHSLRTPISVINGNVDLMKYDMNEEYLENIKIESKKLEILTNNLMNYSMLKENVFLKPETFNVSELFEKECIKFDNMFKSNNIVFEYKIEPNITWYASTGRVLIMLATLLENAAKYTSGKVECILNQNQLIIKNDTNNESGNYMHLFERFKRSDTTKVGFGVGLSIVKLVCDSNDMKINAEVIDGSMIISIDKKAI